MLLVFQLLKAAFSKRWVSKLSKLRRSYNLSCLAADDAKVRKRKRRIDRQRSEDSRQKRSGAKTSAQPETEVFGLKGLVSASRVRFRIGTSLTICPCPDGRLLGAEINRHGDYDYP